MIKNIVVGYDGSPPARVALEQGLDLAEAGSGRIHLVTAIEEFDPRAEQDMLGEPGVIDILDSTERLGEPLQEQQVAVPPYLEEARLRCQEAGTACRLNVGHGRAAAYIQKYWWLADLLVVGRRAKRRSKAGGIGRTLQQLLRAPQRPTLVCAEDYGSTSSLVAVYEQSVTGGRALALAGELGAQLNVPVDVLVAGQRRATLSQWLAQAQTTLQAYHVEGSFESSVSATPRALTSLALDRNPSVVVVPQPGRLLPALGLPALHQAALRLPDTMLLVVP